MAIFRRFTELLTPPPFRRRRETPAPDRPYTPATTIATALEPALRRLVTSPSLEGPITENVLAGLNQVAAEKGLYATALTLKSRLDAMPATDPEGAPYHKARGYKVAGLLFARHILYEIQGVATQLSPVGPAVFKGYCGEMAACLLGSGSVSRCIGEGLLLLDRLLAHIVAEPAKQRLYQELALALVSAISQDVREYLGQESRRAHATPAPREERVHAAALPRATVSEADTGVVAYFREVESKLRKAFANVPQPRIPSPETLGSVVALRAEIEWLHAVLRAANATQYVPLSAITKERIADILAQAHSLKARDFYVSAAADYKAQGRRTEELHLRKLASDCFTKAKLCHDRAHSTPAPDQSER